MKKINQQRLIAIFIGVVMLASIMEVALLRTTPNNGPATAQVPDIVNRRLTLDEMRSALTSGKVVIEYFYNDTCTNCTAKENVYKEVAGSDQFHGFVVLSYGAGNETADWLLDATGTQTDLRNVTMATDLEKMLCGDEIRMFSKPNICLLQGL
jgi:hypothetical protein